MADRQSLMVLMRVGCDGGGLGMVVGCLKELYGGSRRSLRGCVEAAAPY